ncbi:pentapeptide repeat-containing protein [Streptomyces viridochromogenes]|uniref:pentapeptide repeat-containing protein n=1 Tax=Streptomyces viridochromogenes TaxID=1938 RepID=UPI0009989FB8|nr:pentapeptide repeat-containing protein [Streptomyces viridochromogenes]
MAATRCPNLRGSACSLHGTDVEAQKDLRVGQFGSFVDCREGTLPVMTRRTKKFLFGAAALLGALTFAVLFWRLPWWLDGARLREKDLQPADGVVITGVRTGLVALGAAFIAGLGLFYTHITLKHTRERDREQADLVREGQVTDRYIEAIKLLADEGSTKQLGGIYALERIMKDSEKDHSTVVEVLAAFIREHAPLRENPNEGNSGTVSNKPSVVVQAALSVLGRRPIRVEKNRIDLRNVDLRGADISSGYFVGLDFTGSDLRGADCSASHLHGVVLRETQLDGAYFVEALMDGCFLDEAKGVGVNFNSAVLSRASFGECELSEVDFSAADLWASQWIGSSIYKADFELADFRFSMIMNATMGASVFKRAKLALAKVAGSDYPESNFGDSDLDWAIFVAGDLGDAIGIEPIMLSKALIGAKIKLPKNFLEDSLIINRIRAYDGMTGFPMLRHDEVQPQCCLNDSALSHKVGLMYSIPGEDERNVLVQEAVKDWPLEIGVSIAE